MSPGDKIDMRLLDEFQRDFPLVSRPFREIGETLGIGESEVLQRLARLSDQGVVSRVGATIRPNTAGASTLAAIAAPDWRIDEIAEIIGAEAGVNHSYLRENSWNMWFVATGPSRLHVDATLARIGSATGQAVLNLPLERPYHIDLGFALGGAGHSKGVTAAADSAALRTDDRNLLQALSHGLVLEPRPFADLAQRLGCGEAAIQTRIAALVTARIISRFGIIVRHRALGWRSNAMVVWRAPEEKVDGIGARLAAAPGVTLCYRRRTDPDRWPFNLYCMVHSKNREEALSTLERATEFASLEGLPREVLFSVRCFKQTGALVDAGREAPA